MSRKLWKLAALLGICTLVGGMNPITVRASEIEVETTTSLYVKIEAPNVSVRIAPDGTSGQVAEANPGETFTVLENQQNGWVKVDTGSGIGYVQTSKTILFEKSREKVDEGLKTRKDIVNYALQFVGGRYIYGGTDPNTGADCSGFTQYVLSHSAGISLNRTSTEQATQGEAINLDQAKAGDLIFYGGPGYIDHVAIYMGDGKIVHASSAKTGIKVSEWDNRSPVKVVSIVE